MDREECHIPSGSLPQKKYRGGATYDSNSSLPISDSTSPEVEVVLENECFWIHNALTLKEQIEVFADILERSKHVDNTQKRPCMNPSPKTLIFNGQEPTLRFGKKRDCEGGNNEEITISQPLSSIYDELILRRANALVSPFVDGKKTTTGAESALGYNRYSVGVIRYTAPNGSFPEHIDHCNHPNGWVVLLSLGCKARFSVRKGIPKDISAKAAEKKKHNPKMHLELNSGDVLIFDPSSNAAILHGVASILPSTCPQALIDAFGEEAMSNRRYGVQCRTSFES